jgi:hypothetical protein
MDYSNLDYSKLKVGDFVYVQIDYTVDQDRIGINPDWGLVNIGHHDDGTVGIVTQIGNPDPPRKDLIEIDQSKPNHIKTENIFFHPTEFMAGTSSHSNPKGTPNDRHLVLKDRWVNSRIGVDEHHYPVINAGYWEASGRRYDNIIVVHILVGKGTRESPYRYIGYRAAEGWSDIGISYEIERRVMFWGPPVEEYMLRSDGIHVTQKISPDGINKYLKQVDLLLDNAKVREDNGEKVVGRAQDDAETPDKFYEAGSAVIDRWRSFINQKNTGGPYRGMSTRKKAMIGAAGLAGLGAVALGNYLSGGKKKRRKTKRKKTKRRRTKRRKSYRKYY